MPHSVIDSLINQIFDFLKSKGIEPGYFLALVIVPLSLLYLRKHRRDFKGWDDIDYVDKISLVGAIVLALGGVLAFVGTLFGIGKH